MKANVIDLQIIVLITRILQRYECTYSEAREIAISVYNYIDQMQRESEYETEFDYYNHHKTHDAENDIVQAMNFVTPYCPEIK